MQKKILAIQGSSLKKVNVETDTTLFLALEAQKRDYEQTEAGAVRRVTDGGTEINLGSTFVEKLDIKSILPYEGDVIYEGRWGQSFRYGSTVNNATISNPWSNTGNNGYPIIILKNGQHDDGQDPWIPQVEDINTDKSSIYLNSCLTFFLIKIKQVSI